MRKPDIFELEDHLLLAKVTRIARFTTNNGQRIGFSAERQAKDNALIHTFKAALDIVDQGNTSPSNNYRVTAAREALKVGIRDTVNNFLRNNDAVTDDDMKTAGIPVPKKTRDPKPSPKTHPEGEFTLNGSGGLTGRFHDEKAKAIAIPKTADSLEVRIVFIDKAGTIHTWQETFHHARPAFCLPPEFRNRKCRAQTRWRCNNGIPLSRMASVSPVLQKLSFPILEPLTTCLFVII